MTVPTTSVRTSHAVVIRAGGIVVAMIQSWNPNQSMTVTPVYQLNSDSLEGTGNVFENVPGNIGGLTVSINRIDLYTRQMEQAWGPTFDIQMLTDQKIPLDVLEKWKSPTNEVKEYRYSGFYFTSLGRTISATDNRIVNVSASAMYAKVVRIQ